MLIKTVTMLSLWFLLIITDKMLVLLCMLIKTVSMLDLWFWLTKTVTML
jgi:hypothetical protein